MDIQSTLYFQIVADVVLCVAMAVLLLRSGRQAGHAKNPAMDQQSLRQFRQLLAESQIAAERFIQTIDEGYRKFRGLAVDLEKREERLKSLIEEINECTKKADVIGHSGDEPNCRKKYEAIMKYLEEGLPLEEIAGRTGITSGEILLIAELEKVRQGKAKEAGR